MSGPGPEFYFSAARIDWKKGSSPVLPAREIAIPGKCAGRGSCRLGAWD